MNLTMNNESVMKFQEIIETKLVFLGLQLSQSLCQYFPKIIHLA